MICKRPWGFWLLLHQWPLFIKGPRYKLKLLYFKRGGAISMQRHNNRSENWKNIFGIGVFDPDPIGYDYRNILWKSRYFERQEWHQYTASSPTLVLETQRGICTETDIERV